MRTTAMRIHITAIPAEKQQGIRGAWGSACFSRHGLHDGRGLLGRMRPKIIANFQIHPVNLCQQPTRGHTVVFRVGFDLANVRNLPLELKDALLCNLKLTIILNHGPPPLLALGPRSNKESIAQPRQVKPYEFPTRSFKGHYRTSVTFALAPLA